VDECAAVSDSRLCDVNEYCVNVAGSFKCASKYCCYICGLVVCLFRSKNCYK